MQAPIFGLDLIVVNYSTNEPDPAGSAIPAEAMVPLRVSFSAEAVRSDKLILSEHLGGVAVRAPYLHNGSAATLDGVPPCALGRKRRLNA